MATILKGKLVASKVYNSAEPVKLRFDLTNSGDQDLYVLKWYTPLEGLNSDCLTVIRNEKRKVAYDGPMIKRGHPGPDDYVLIPAGGTVTADVDVSESYAVSIPADYRVELNIPALEYIPALAAAKPSAALALAKSTPASQKLTGGKTQFKVEKGAIQIPTRGKMARKMSKAVAKSTEADSSVGAVVAVVAAAALLPPIITGGTASKQASAKQAHIDGFQLCEAALAGVANNAQYKEWFGPIPRLVSTR